MTIRRRCSSSKARSPRFARIVSNVASNDALVRLSDDVQLLSSKVDQLARSERHTGDSFARARTAHRRADLGAGRPRAAGHQRQFRTARRRAAGAVRPHRPHAGRQRRRVGLRPSRAARLLSARTAGSLHRSRRRPSRPGRGRAAGHPAPSRTPARSLSARRRDRNAQRAAAAAARHRPDRSRQARTVRHPLQPDGRPTATPRIRWKPFTTRSAMWSTGWR